jgi:hypothetical protein
MVTDCIYSIDLTTNSNDILSITSDDFQNLYISNIDDNGEEIPYTQNKKSNELYANFFMVKVLNENNTNYEFIDRLYNKKDIIKLTLKFTNGLKQEFDLAKKRVLNNGVIENKHEHIHFQDEDLCILITDKKIKYKENLFQ